METAVLPLNYRPVRSRYQRPPGGESRASARRERGIIILMRFRVPFLSLLAMSFIVIPHFAHAAIPFFGPIIPDGINRCPLGWGAVILVINNIIELALTIAIVAIAPVMLAWAGFLMMTQSTSIGSVSKAKSLIWNTVIGIVIALAAWLIVDALLVAFTNHGADYWTSKINTGGQGPCIEQAGSSVDGNTGTGSNGGIQVPPPPGGTSAGKLCTSGACASAALQGLGLNSAQANAMSCIAMTESSGNPFGPPSSTGACGLFQIIQGNWSDPAFHTGQCSVSTSCNDPACNAQTAYLLFQQRGYQPWSGTCNTPSGCAGGIAYGQPWNPGAQACVNKYDPDH